MSSGALYLVATPIGNLEDITLRALRILRQADLVAAEDTRRTLQLLRHFEITTRIVSYHAHSMAQREDYLVQRMLDGDSIALVTDAGTPAISDPGFELVVRAIASDISVVSIPGASALMTALPVSGLCSSPFVFEGFLPRRKALRLKAINRFKTESRTSVIYEAPHRVEAVLKDLHAVLGNRPIVVARELTKLHEEVWRGGLKAAVERWSGDLRGEFVIVLGGAPEPTEESLENDREGRSAFLDKTLFELVASGLSRRDAARRASELLDLPFRETYRRACSCSAERVGE